MGRKLNTPCYFHPNYWVFTTSMLTTLKKKLSFHKKSAELSELVRSLFSLNNQAAFDDRFLSILIFNCKTKMCQNYIFLEMDANSLSSGPRQCDSSVRVSTRCGSFPSFHIVVTWISLFPKIFHFPILSPSGILFFQIFFFSSPISVSLWTAPILSSPSISIINNESFPYRHHLKSSWFPPSTGWHPVCY